jgi:hypothetical protein
MYNIYNLINISYNELRERRKNKHKKDYYVYAFYDSSLSSPFSHFGLPFYIGKGRHLRCVAHFDSNRIKNNTYLYKKIRKMISKKLPINIIILEDYLYEKESYQKEKIYIADFKKRGFQLCNHNDGGLGRLGEKVSEETRKKMSQSQKGKKPKEESIQKMLQTRKENGSYKCSNESRLKMSISRSHKYENYICIDSNGNKFNVDNLNLFCRIHKLTSARMNQIAKSWRGIFYKRNDGYGKKINLSHKGWRCFYESDFTDDYWKCTKFLVKDQNEQLFYVNNLTEFAKQKELNSALLQRSLRSGKKYKGYTVSNNPIYLEKFGEARRD